MEPELSVIIPCYNSAATIEACLDSVLAQTFTDIEILVVDGGSEDGTVDIVSEYEKKDPRIRLIYSETRGVSCQRNRGLFEARGTFFQFVDSDDCLPAEGCMRLMNATRDSEPDIVIAGFHYISKGYDRIPKEGDYKGAGPFFANLEEYYSPEKLFLNSPCNKLYRKDVIQVTFPENMDLGEDLFFNLDAIRLARQIRVIPEVVYLVDDSDRESLSRRFRPDGFAIETAIHRRMLTVTSALLGEPPRYLYGLYIHWVKGKLFGLVNCSGWAKQDIQREIYRWCGAETLRDALARADSKRMKDRVLLRWLGKKRVGLIYFYYKHFG